MQKLDLNAYRGRYRLLLLFAPDDAHPDYKHQLDILDNAQYGVADRDLLLFMLFEQGSGFAGRQVASPLFAAAVRRQFDVPEGQFTLLLIGKDGTEKHRDQRPMNTFELFARIDTMPMRRREMRQRGIRPADE